MNPIEKMVRDLRNKIEKLEIEGEELKGEIEDFKDSFGYDEVINAVYNFCYVCPIRDSIPCITCYLRRWKNKPD